MEPSTSAEAVQGVKKKKKLAKDNTNEASPIFYGRCHKCGTNTFDQIGHKAKDCQEKVRCQYPLCLATGEATHNIATCNVLHGICYACRRRGHMAIHHENMDIVSMETMFALWQPYGCLTSIPLLAGTDSARQPENKEFRYGHYNRSFNEGLTDKEM